MSTPRRVYLHIGLHKTGTTYLQNLFRVNRENLRAAGIEYPGGPGEVRQTMAVFDLHGARPRGYNDPRVHGQWSALVTSVETSGCPRALVSEERLSISTRRQARKAVESFSENDVHVVVTARDLGRVMVSQWQEDIKGGATTTWQQYAASVRDPAQRAMNPARQFWVRQDLERVLDIWGSIVPADHIHIVTVPRPGSSSDLLVSRLASVVGFSADVLKESPNWTNESVGVAEIEVIRRVNERLKGTLNKAQRDRVFNGLIVREFASRPDTARFALPKEEVAWVRTRAEHFIRTIERGGYEVVGDLDELRVDFTPGRRRPDDAGIDELLEASLQALAVVAEELAGAWWLRRRRRIESQTGTPRLSSRVRGAYFETQRRAARLAERNRMSAKALEVGMRLRDGVVSDRRSKRARARQAD
jgi:hypothetical protein